MIIYLRPMQPIQLSAPRQSSPRSAATCSFTIGPILNRALTARSKLARVIRVIQRPSHGWGQIRITFLVCPVLPGSAGKRRKKWSAKIVSMSSGPIIWRSRKRRRNKGNNQKLARKDQLRMSQSWSRRNVRRHCTVIINWRERIWRRFLKRFELLKKPFTWYTATIKQKITLNKLKNSAPKWESGLFSWPV